MSDQVKQTIESDQSVALDEVGESNVITEKREETGPLNEQTNTNVVLNDIDSSSDEESDEDDIVNETIDSLDGLVLDPTQDLDLTNIEMRVAQNDPMLGEIDRMYEEKDPMFIHAFKKSVAPSAERDYMMKMFMNEEFCINRREQACRFIRALQGHIRKLKEGEDYPESAEPGNDGEHPLTIQEVSNDEKETPDNVGDDCELEVVEEQGVKQDVDEDPRDWHLNALEQLYNIFNVKKPKIPINVLFSITPILLAYPECQHPIIEFIKYIIHSIQRSAKPSHMEVLRAFLNDFKEMRKQMEDYVAEQERLQLAYIFS